MAKNLRLDFIALNKLEESPEHMRQIEQVLTDLHQGAIFWIIRRFETSAVPQRPIPITMDDMWKQFLVVTSKSNVMPYRFLELLNGTFFLHNPAVNLNVKHSVEWSAYCTEKPNQTGADFRNWAKQIYGTTFEDYEELLPAQYRAFRLARFAFNRTPLNVVDNTGYNHKGITVTLNNGGFECSIFDIFNVLKLLPPKPEITAAEAVELLRHALRTAPVTEWQLPECPVKFGQVVILVDHLGRSRLAQVYTADYHRLQKRWYIGINMRHVRMLENIMYPLFTERELWDPYVLEKLGLDKWCSYVTIPDIALLQDLSNQHQS
jgi:hypothetical protein